MSSLCVVCGDLILDPLLHRCSATDVIMKLGGECAALRSERDEARELARMLAGELRKHVAVPRDLALAMERWDT